jgi:hypothetical protein
LRTNLRLQCIEIYRSKLWEKLYGGLGIILWSGVHDLEGASSQFYIYDTLISMIPQTRFYRNRSIPNIKDRFTTIVGRRDIKEAWIVISKARSPSTI